MNSSGRIRYTFPYKINVEVDPELVRYYRALTPIDLNSTRYAPHITVLREETPLKLEHWGKYEGKEISFSYSPIVNFNEIYWWLEAYSQELLTLRVELGLPPLSELARPPDGADCFHFTIGNRKNL